MSTIDELIRSYKNKSLLSKDIIKPFVQDGSFRVTRPDWDDDYYLMPYYKTKNYWYGLDCNRNSSCYKHDANDFEIYVETRKKLKHWLWTSREQVKFCSYNPQARSDEPEWMQIPGSEVEL